MVDQLLKDLETLQEDQAYALRQFGDAYVQQDSLFQRLCALDPREGEARMVVHHMVEQDEHLAKRISQIDERQTKMEEVLQEIRDQSSLLSLTAQQQQAIADRQAEQTRIEQDMLAQQNEYYDQKRDTLRRKADIDEAASQLPGGVIRLFRDRVFYRMALKETERGDYFSFVPLGDVNPYTGRRTLSDKQLREAIVRLAAEGCNIIYCYNGNKLDPQLTSRAQSMVREMTKPNHILDGFDLTVSESRMKTLEPWRRDNFLSNYFHQRAFEKDAKEYAKADEKAVKQEWSRPFVPWN